MVLLEAMAAGAPVIASHIQGYASVLTHGREGFMVEPKDPSALAVAITRLLSDRPLRAVMGEAGRRTARTYDWPIVAGRVLAYYEKVMATRGRPVTAHSRTWTRMRRTV